MNCQIQNPDSSERRDSIAHSKHLHPLPLECSKIVAGVTRDPLVVKIYGEGCYDKNDGHGGARYFTDLQKKVILKTVIGVDRVIEEVGLTQYDFPFDFVSKKTDSIPSVEELLPDPLLIKNIHFGDSFEKITEAFGQPNMNTIENDIRSITYDDSTDQWEEVLFYSATFEFRSNKLVRISIYNGE